MNAGVHAFFPGSERVMIGLTIPSYERFQVGDARVVAVAGCAASIREVLEKERLYEYASVRRTLFRSSAALRFSP